MFLTKIVKNTGFRTSCGKELENCAGNGVQSRFFPYFCPKTSMRWNDSEWAFSVPGTLR